MRATRNTVFGLLLGFSAAAAPQGGAAGAVQPPAELPPASYEGQQYVDSRGCIFIRAGIDGAVTWAPMVTRERRQICDQQPTFAPPPEVASVPEPAPSPEPPESAPVNAATAPPAEPAPLPLPESVEEAGAIPAKPAEPAPMAHPRPTRKTARKTAPKPAPATRAATPAEPAAPKRRAAWWQRRATPVDLPPDTRVIPRHVYENRRNTTNVAVPRGYRPAWDDDRLNPRRAEMSYRPAQVRGIIRVPAGHKIIDWGDGRLNLRRGQRTAQGDADTSRIWTETVPRKLVVVPTTRPVVPIPSRAGTIQSADTQITRVSTRSEPAKPAKGIYVRVQTYPNAAQARPVAAALVAGTGLPVRLGIVRQGNACVVLAGPFPTRREARKALGQVRAAGYLDARLAR